MSLMYICAECLKKSDYTPMDSSENEYICTICHERKACKKVNSLISNSITPPTTAPASTKKVRQHKKPPVKAEAALVEETIQFPGEKKEFVPPKRTSRKENNRSPRGGGKTPKKITAGVLRRITQESLSPSLDKILNKAIEKAKLGSTFFTVSYQELQIDSSQITSIEAELTSRGFGITRSSKNSIKITWN